MKHDFTTVQSEKLSERYYRFSHKSGLAVYVLPKSFSTAYAILATRYGSLEQTFRIRGEEEYITVPDGVAHFLEHKMFEEEDGTDAFVKFAPFGASANAYTANDKTAYLFSATDHFLSSLRVLLSFVTHPYFTEENVKKEQGIIGQEIGMSFDRPARRLWYTVYDALYKHHNIRTDICGTVESISRITPEILYRCYNTFYHPSNMALCIVGNVDPQEVMDVVDEMLPEKAPIDIETVYPEEPNEISARRITVPMQVSRPLFGIAFKDPYRSEKPEDMARRAAAMQILLDIVFEDPEPVYASLYNDRLLSDPFSMEYEYGNGYAHAILSGESDAPEEVYLRVMSAVEKMRKNPPSEADFLRARRALYASAIQVFDSPEDIGDSFIDALFSGSDIFNKTLLLNEITYAEVLEALNDFYTETNTVMATVVPLNNNEREKRQ